jgi:3-hydroxyisobutyrate dehydrogenase-like beta-hydroxyacid dehydrogenase
MNNGLIAFLGTGLMGEPMARNLMASGYSMRAWNRSKTKLATLAENGATVCDTPAEAARGANTLICMLSDGPTCDAVLFDDSAVLEALAPGATLIVMSSIPVETAVEQARRSAERGFRYLDAPVSGGQQGAIDATLAIMAGGNTETFDASRRVLEKMGRPVHVGPVGTGQQTKLANQLIVASTIAAVAEALLFAERGGADPEKVLQALQGGFADSTILRKHGRRMIDGNFVPGGPAKYQVKDTRTALARASALELELPVSQVVNALFGAMVEHGDGDIDHSGLIREIRRVNRLPEDREI